MSERLAAKTAVAAPPNEQFILNAINWPQMRGQLHFKNPDMVYLNGCLQQMQLPETFEGFL